MKFNWNSTNCLEMRNNTRCVPLRGVGHISKQKMNTHMLQMHPPNKGLGMGGRVIPHFKAVSGISIKLH